MPSLVYSLERDRRAPAADARGVATDSLIAIATALAGERDVRYLELSEEGSPSPMYSVSFPSETLMTTCNARIEQELLARGVKIRKIHVIESDARTARLSE